MTSLASRRSGLSEGHVPLSKMSPTPPFHAACPLPRWPLVSRLWARARIQDVSRSSFHAACPLPRWRLVSDVWARALIQDVSQPPFPTECPLPRWPLYTPALLGSLSSFKDGRRPSPVAHFQRPKPPCRLRSKGRSAVTVFFPDMLRGPQLAPPVAHSFPGRRTVVGNMAAVSGLRKDWRV